MRLLKTLSFVLAAMVCFTPPAPFAQDAPQEGKKEAKKKGKGQKKAEKKEAAAPAGAPGSDPATDAMMKAMLPGERHKALEPLIGEWTASVSMLVPGSPPMKTPGEATRKWILGGRFVQEDFKGEMMGMPFQGQGLTGYDNVLKMYSSSWVDSLGTGLMYSTGQGDETGKVLTLNGSYGDPQTGKPQKVRLVTTIKDKDHHTFKLIAIDDAGKETPAMEIEYTRKK